MASICEKWSCKFEECIQSETGFMEYSFYSGFFFWSSFLTNGLVLTNYQPISKLPFLSKVLEKVVFHQLSSFFKHNDILDRFQSGFTAQNLLC